VRVPRRARALAVAVPALAPLLLPVPAAAATDDAGGTGGVADVVVDTAAWSWRRVTAGLPVGGVEPSGVPAGSLAAASDGGPTPAKATYLRLGLPADLSSASALTFSLPVDPQGQQVDVAGVQLVACRLAAGFPPGGEGVDPATMPDADCTGAPEGAYDAATGAWTFDLAGHLTAWLTAGPDDGARGAFVVQPPAGARPFQVVFQGGSAGRGTLTTASTVSGGSTGVDDSWAGGGWDGDDGGLPGLATGTHDAFSGGTSPTLGELLAPSTLTGSAPRSTTPQPQAAEERRVAVRPAAPREPVLAAPHAGQGGMALAAALLAALLVGVARVAGDSSGVLARARVERRMLDA
jgi:hypothetical protein